jgi:cytoskeletal protein CcmA (bactofilin family)
MFSKKPAQPRATYTGSEMATQTRGGASSFSVLGADLSIKGDLTANADLHIDGKVEGDVDCTSLVQGETSAIHGMVRAKSARLSGTVHGSIEVGELVILKSARIHGDVSYDALTIEQGAQVDGRFTHRTNGARVDTKADDAAARLTLAS